MNTPLSFEFFPPKTAEGAVKLRQVREQLYALKPEFCSVTYGAGGSTQEGTFATVSEILKEGCEAASHFSCIGATRARVREQLQQLQAMGVRRLVALRGDLPSGYGAGGEFTYASDLVEFIRAETGAYFHIEVAAYPEVHPQAKSPEADLQALVAKVRAGADSATLTFAWSKRPTDWGCRRRSCRASCPSPARRNCCAFPMPAAPKSRAGFGSAWWRTVTTLNRSVLLGWKS